MEKQLFENYPFQIIVLYGAMIFFILFWIRYDDKNLFVKFSVYLILYFLINSVIYFIGSTKEIADYYASQYIGLIILAPLGAFLYKYIRKLIASILEILRLKFHN